MYTWLELNAVESTVSLDNILRSIDLFSEEILIPGITKRYFYSKVYPRLYGLAKYVEGNFVGIVSEDTVSGIKIYIISSDDEIIEEIVKETLTKDLRIDRLGRVSTDELRRILKYRKNELLDFYFKLALRNYLLKHYKPVRLGKRTFWALKPNEGMVYIFDADVDPGSLKGYISIDFRMLSNITLWDKIQIGEYITRHVLESLVGQSVMVTYGKRFAYGKIKEMLYQKVSEPVKLNNGELNLIEYYKRKKGRELNPNEYPIVFVEIAYPDVATKRILPYPPSEIRLLLPIEKPDPETRFSRIEKVLYDLINNFSLFTITFTKAKIRFKRYVNVIKDIELKYGNTSNYRSPLFMMQKRDAHPLHGPLEIPELVLFMPLSIIDDKITKNDVYKLARVIQLFYSAYNLGKIKKVSIKYYDIVDDPSKLKIIFSNLLSRILSRSNPIETMLVPVIVYNYLFDIAKKVCSDKGFHARVIEEDTIRELVIQSKETGLFEHSSIKELSKALKNDLIEDKQLLSTISNIVFSLYVEFLIQKHVYLHKIPNKLTWALEKPADNYCNTLYLGFDVSRISGSRNDVAVVFILFDSYGEMINASIRRVTGEKLSGEILHDILITLIAPLKSSPSNISQLNRLVIYKDGGIRSKDEFNSLKNVFNTLGKELKLKRLEIIGIIKRHNLRLFSKRGEQIKNPRRGTWIKLWDINRYGVKTERALICMSRIEGDESGTIKPVILERYVGPFNTSPSTQQEKPLEDIVKEYIRLCRLDFWNPLDGYNKYPLPILMADKLAYLAMKGIPIKTP